jgi:DNA helicase II / ATP-dependent DNA helicase PcrA
MPSTNRVIISAAGSGKTTKIVQEAISNPNKKIALVTYTINNVNEIRKKFYDLNGSIPCNVTIQSWFSFLLSECVRPYQNFVYDKRRVGSIAFVNKRSAKYVPKNDKERYYFFDSNIYTDKISEFAIECNATSNGLVINRLENIYDDLYIDEIQDMAGYDLDLIELLLKSKIKIMIVGDIRQATYSTNSSAKNMKYRGMGLIKLIELWAKDGICHTEFLSQSYRCNQEICDFADELYPEMPLTQSNNLDVTPHDGIFSVPENLIEQYILKYSPKILRYSKTTISNCDSAINFGEAKGQTFSRVLILPNGPINNFLRTGDSKYIMNERAKLYVAITRAKYSVAFVFNGRCKNLRIIALTNIDDVTSEPDYQQLQFF